MSRDLRLWHIEYGTSCGTVKMDETRLRSQRLQAVAKRVPSDTVVQSAITQTRQRGEVVMAVDDDLATSLLLVSPPSLADSSRAHLLLLCQLQ